MVQHTDTHEARELLLFATNDAQLYRSRITPIIENLKKKIKKGVYDKVLALKLWRYAADDAAKRYNKEFVGTTAGFGIFTVPIRNEIATLLQEYYDEELHYGNNPAKRKGTSKPRRVSQITGKPPTKRLVARRRANTAPGYFPNPIADKLAIWLNAGNDSNGNPRRMYVVVDTQGEVLSIHDEGYSGSSAVTGPYPGIAIVGQFHITPAQYRELKKVYKAKFHAA